MTDIYKFEKLFDEVGVKYRKNIYQEGIDLEVLEESINTYHDVNIVFNNGGEFMYFEPYE